MHTDLGSHKAVGVLAIDHQGSRLDASLLTGLCIRDFGFESPPFGPSQVHPLEHPGPVLSLGTARPCIQRHDRVGLVVLARKQGFRFDLIQAHGEALNLVSALVFDRLAFGGQL